MKGKILIIWIVLFVQFVAAEEKPLSTVPYPLSIDDVILDIYHAVTELGEADFEQLQTDLYALHEHPINLNATSDEELSRLYFLSPRQIDDILAYADKHPFESLYELRMIASLADYEIRDLLPFVTIPPTSPSLTAPNNILYAREVFRRAGHEVITRFDALKIGTQPLSDPTQEQLRYRFDYQRRVTFGAQVKRPAGSEWKDLQFGAYLQLRDIGHLHSLVAGNFQASFGQGLVLAPAYHSGKSTYVQSAGQAREGLNHYSAVDGSGLHGAGATIRWEWNTSTRLDISALYSMKRANDSMWHHLVGANLTFRHDRLQIGLTAVENIWSDSIRPYRNTAYNRHYFRGYSQAVLGASFRYNFGVADLFGEVATAQNHEIINQPSQIANTEQHWGVGVLFGSRFYPADGISLIALYRYYSPFFDNPLGYAFSETTRLGDENGGYLGFDITRLRKWRFSGYADVFYFSGPKYGIPQAGTIGYDALAEMAFHKDLGFQIYDFKFRARARKKGDISTYSARAQFNWQSGGWSLRTTAEANLTNQNLSSETSNHQSATNYGFTVYQDIAFDFTPYTVHHMPLGLCLRFQGFDARNWDNRIYVYEHDVLYAYSVPAVYGLGGRAYVCLRYQVLPQVTIYLRVSETLYQKAWATAHDTSVSRTDIHLLVRAKL